MDHFIITCAIILIFILIGFIYLRLSSIIFNIECIIKDLTINIDDVKDIKNRLKSIESTVDTDKIDDGK